MRIIFVLLSLLASVTASAQIEGVMHCGYDFTSYLVLDVHEEGKKENIKGLKITIVDSLGNDVININNLYSWNNGNKPMQFTLNYQIDENGNRLTVENPKARWFFPYAKDNYLLSVANTFPADNFRLKVEDPKAQYKTQWVPLYAFNMYVLCASQSEKAVQFGRKQNRPITIVLSKQ